MDEKEIDAGGCGTQLALGSVAAIGLVILYQYNQFKTRYEQRVENVLKPEALQLGDGFIKQYHNQRLSIDRLLQAMENKIYDVEYKYEHITLSGNYTGEDLLAVAFSYQKPVAQRRLLEENPKIEIFGAEIPYRDALVLVEEIKKSPSQYQFILDRAQAGRSTQQGIYGMR